MRRTPFKAKRDANEPDIIEALEAHGVIVERMDKPVDLLCNYRGRVFLAEVKAPSAYRDKRQTAQNKFVDLWQVPILRTDQDVADTVAKWNEAIKTGDQDD